MDCTEIAGLKEGKLGGGFGLFEGGEAAAVDGGEAILLHHVKVQLGAVAFVFIEAVFGIERVVLIHQFVAVYFSDDGCGGNALARGVAFNDGLLWKFRGWKIATIDQDKVWLYGKGADGLLHGQKCGAQYIELVDFFWSDEANGVVDVRMAREVIGKALSLLWL